MKKTLIVAILAIAFGACSTKTVKVESTSKALYARDTVKTEELYLKPSIKPTPAEKKSMVIAILVTIAILSVNN